MTRLGSRLPLAMIPALLFGLLVSSAALAASTGRICGQVTAFTAPTAVADGSITIDGTAEVIDSSAAASLAAGTITTLTAVAMADATTCVDITAAGDGSIVSIAVAAAAEVCGEVTLDTATGITSVNGVMLATSLLSADAGLSALLDLALAAGADVCVDLTVDTTSGLIVGVAVSADFDLCGTVEVDGAGNATVDGVTIPADLLDTDAAAALRLAALVDATACVNVTGATNGGSTTVDVGVTATICATVTAVGDGTLTLEGITLNVAADAAAGIEVGDDVCVGVAPAGDGSRIVEVNGNASATPPGATAPGVAAPGATAPPAVSELPDSAAPAPAPVPVLAFGLLLVASVGLTLRFGGDRAR